MSGNIVAASSTAQPTWPTSRARDASPPRAQIDAHDAVFRSNSAQHRPGERGFEGSKHAHSLARHAIDAARGGRRTTLRTSCLFDGHAALPDLDEAEAALLELAADPRVLADPKPRFLVVSYGDSAINVRLRAYAEYDDFFDLYWDLNRRLKGVLDARGIDIPFPQRVVRHVGGAPAPAEGDEG